MSTPARHLLHRLSGQETTAVLVVVLLTCCIAQIHAAPPLGSLYRPAYSAKQILENDPSASDGIYWIDPDGGDISNSFQAYFDMTTDGGGWTLGLVGLRGAPLHSSDISSIEGTAGYNSRHTVDLTHLAINQQAQLRHQIINGGVLFEGFYTGTYHGVMASQGAWTVLSGDPGYISASMGQTWKASSKYGGTYNGCDTSWYYGGNDLYGTIPTAYLTLQGPYNSQPGVGYVDAYRIFVRELAYTPVVETPITRWTSNSDGNWDTGYNWVYHTSPDPTDDVRIMPERGVEVHGSSGDQTINSLVVGAEVGTSTLLLPHDLDVVEGVVVEQHGLLTMQGSTLTTGGGFVVEGQLTGHGTVAGRVSGASNSILIADDGNMTLGDLTTYAGFTTEGTIDTEDNTVTLRSAGYARLGVLTTLGGGQLNAPNGVGLGTGDNVVGNGAVNAKIVAAPGSTFTAIHSLSLGDPLSYAGFASNGVTNVNDQEVTLLDANDSVFDSLAFVDLGTAGTGQLAAVNGITLDFGGNVTGYGTVDTPNSVSTPFINNGHITGNSLTEPITLTGYVKGVGTMDNVVITGTDAPGFSPAPVQRGSVSYMGALEIELGGLVPGSEHDQIVHSGTAALGGELSVKLIDGFIPNLGEIFEVIVAAGGVIGTFASQQLPDLGLLLTVDVFYSTNAVTLAVMPALDGDYNADGVVDAADYVVWRNTKDQVGPGLVADGNHDNVIDTSDYNLWRSHFGQTAGRDTVSSSAQSLSAAVPEPSMWRLLILVAISFAVRLRRMAS